MTRLRYFNQPPNEEIEMMPEELRNILDIKPYYPPTPRDFINEVLDKLPVRAEFSAEDIVLAVWRLHDVIVDIRSVYWAVKYHDAITKRAPSHYVKNH